MAVCNVSAELRVGESRYREIEGVCAASQLNKAGLTKARMLAAIFSLDFTDASFPSLW